MNLKNIWLFFDLDDTLYDQLTPFRTACNLLFSDCHLPIQKLFVLYRKYSDEVFELAENNKISMEEMYIYRIKNAMKEYNIDINDELALKFQYVYQKSQNLITLFPDMVDVLRYCKNHSINRGIITNGPQSHQLKKYTNLKLSQYICEKYIWISSSVGIAKPNKGIFEFVENQIDSVERNQIFLIGDSFENDITGAKNAGWKAIWINRRKNSIPNSSSIVPDKIVSDGNELLEYIKTL